LDRIKELEAKLTHLVSTRRKLLRVVDREFDSVDGHSCLIGHLEFNRRRARLNIGFDLFKNLMHCLRTHWDTPNCATSSLLPEMQSAVSIDPAVKSARHSLELADTAHRKACPC
jgi:hypothetical protein